MPLGEPLLEALERMRCGGIILNGTGEVARLNSVAKDYLRKYASLAASTLANGDWTNALRRLIGARKGHSAGAADVWVPIADRGEPQLVLYSRRVSSETDEDALTLVTLVDLGETPQPGEQTLQTLFGLTPAETRLARELARGLSPGEAAEKLEVRTTTARSQLSSIFAKTGTRRQGELVALLLRVAVLP